MKTIRSTKKYKKKVENFLKYELGDVQELPLVLDEASFHEMLISEQNRDMSQLAKDLDFHNSAKSYSKFDRFEKSNEKAHVLAEFYNKFGAQGSQPLIDRHGARSCSPGYVGKIFEEMFKGVSKRVGYA